MGTDGHARASAPNTTYAVAPREALPNKVLGVRVRRVADGLLVGKAAQLVVEAERRSCGWMVVARDVRDEEVIAHGVGRDLERAEESAQDDFVRRMNRAARRGA